jgi:hypothetical protein
MTESGAERTDVPAVEPGRGLDSAAPRGTRCAPGRRARQEEPRPPRRPQRPAHRAGRRGTARRRPWRRRRPARCPPVHHSAGARNAPYPWERERRCPCRRCSVATHGGAPDQPVPRPRRTSCLRSSPACRVRPRAGSCDGCVARPRTPRRGPHLADATPAGRTPGGRPAQGRGRPDWTKCPRSQTLLSNGGRTSYARTSAPARRQNE